MQELLTLGEAANALRLSTRQVRDIIRRGELYAYRIGSNGSIRVPAVAVDALLETYVPPCPPAPPEYLFTASDALKAAGVCSPTRSDILAATQWLRGKGVPHIRKAGVKGFQTSPDIINELKASLA